jgi:predicted nucleic acid-binding protein
MAYLFDTDAISEVLKPRPAPGYVRWLAAIPRDEQFTSAVVVGELYKGAFRSAAAARHLDNLETRVLPAVTVLSYDVGAARVYGQIRAHLESAGRPLADADLQIAATALLHDLELVTRNVKHFGRVPGLRISSALAKRRKLIPGPANVTLTM